MCMQWRPVCSEVSTRSHISLSVTAIGVSMNACAPAFIAATPIGPCFSHGVAMTTMSGFTSVSIVRHRFSSPK